MTEFLCKITLKRLCDKDIIKEENVEVYHYGLELLLATIFKLTGIICIGLFTGLVKETIIYTLYFSGLRIQAGGYHAKTIMGCFIGAVLLTFTSIILVGTLPNDYQPRYILISMVISIILVFIYAPLESENKPLSEDEKVLYRSRSLGTVIIGSIIILFLIYLNRKFTYLGSIALTGFLLESLTLIHIPKKQQRH